MAYNVILDTRIAVGKPGDNNLFTDLRDNPIAIANGDAGAPKIQNAAINTDAISIDKMQDNSVSSAEIVDNSVRFSNEISTPSDDVNLNASAAGTAIPAGVYNLGRWTGGATLPTLYVEFYCGSVAGWLVHPGIGWPISHNNDVGIQVVSDGVSVRLRSSATTGTCQARRIAV